MLQEAQCDDAWRVNAYLVASSMSLLWLKRPLPLLLLVVLVVGLFALPLPLHPANGKTSNAAKHAINPRTINRVMNNALLKV